MIRLQPTSAPRGETVTKITSVVLIDEKTGSDSRQLVAKIESDGRLMLEGYDLGPEVEKYWGDSDYEYWLTVAADYKDSLLLRLLQDRFSTSSAFMDWLKSQEIPYQFSSYA
jgi:hypothetical protein